MGQRLWRILTLALLLTTLATPGLAQTPTSNEINAIAKELWCPLCNGVRLDNCELQACVQMREVIAEKLEEGANTEQIKAYFVEQYGDVVLGAPANEGFNRVVWLFPILAAVVGLGWLAFVVRTWVQRRPVPAEAAAPEQAQDADESDDYLARVDDELKKYL